MRVLQLVNTPRSFFEKQVDVLERLGVECTTLTVPGVHSPEETRSPVDYAKYYPQVLNHLRGDYDLVHAHYGLMGPFAIAQPAVPTVLTLWGSDLMMDHPFVPRLSRLSARLSDAVIVPSRVMGEALSTPHHLVPWGIDTELFRPIDRDRAREHVGWVTDEPIALFPYKAGREVKNYPLAERVVDAADAEVDLRTLNDVPYEDVPYYMNAADLVLVTSRRESGPMVVKEAAACNVPVVSTDVGFVRETIEDVSHSYVCTSVDELVAGLEAVVRDRPRSDGRERVDGLSLESSGEHVRAVYRNVLAGE
nr:glycosyltransferase family 4 protein [Natrononativus amylolyticus]